ncbi:hypothetical protein MRX96_032752 [Rhipicephalus microplus]
MSSVIARVRDGSLRAIRERDVHRFRWWSLYAQQLADRGKAKTSDAAALSFARSLRVVRFPSDARSVLQSTGGGCGGGGVDGRASAPLLSHMPSLSPPSRAPKWPRHATPGPEASRSLPRFRSEWEARVHAFVIAVTGKSLVACAVDREGDSSPVCMMGCWFFLRSPTMWSLSWLILVRWALFCNGAGHFEHPPWPGWTLTASSA